MLCVVVIPLAVAQLVSVHRVQSEEAIRALDRDLICVSCTHHQLVSFWGVSGRVDDFHGLYTISRMEVQEVK